MKWTEDQLKAIETRNKNLLVSAAAGSGKTALLIERIRRIIMEEKTSVDALLVLTFTRAAAAEMKERLNIALMAELEKPEADSEFIINQVNRLGGASISTLHAFCSTLVRDYFQEGGVDPEFTLGNETELSIMVQETLEELFEENYLEIPQDGETPFSLLVEQFTGNRNDRELKSIVEKLHYFFITQPDSEAFCERALSYLALEPAEFWGSPWGKELMVLLQTDVGGAYELLESARAHCLEEPGFEKTAAQLQEDIFSVGLAIDALEEGYDTFQKSLKEIEFKRFSGNKKADEILNEQLKRMRNEAKEIIKGLQKKLAVNLEEALLLTHKMKAPTEALIALTRDFQKKYLQKKEEKNLLDFNDLEQVTLRILKNPDIAKEVQEKYAHVFLDEYQDTNEMQEAIIQSIVKENNYFMVGDVKQSIYRFRLADPTIFIEKYHGFGKNENTLDALVTLSQNFRSSQSVVDGVNTVFEAIMSPELGEIEYDARARLYKGLSAEGPYHKTTVHIIDKKTSDNEDPALEDLSDTEKEARFIAREIQRMVGQPIFDTKEGENRVLRYRDIGVLMRAVSGRGDVYARIFSEMGIPAYFDGGNQYYESMEISVIMNLLNLVDNKRQDLPLLSVMTSPIGGFTTDECTAIRLFQKEGTYYAAAEKYCETREDILAQKLRKFYDALKNWQWDSRIMAIEDFLWKLYLETDFYHFVGALPGGDQRQNNLRVLLKRAGDYKRSTLKGLFYFIRFIERMKKHRYDMSPPSILSANEDVVRIMTIHKSKGLEFPVVFLSGAGTGFNKRAGISNILFHKSLGICPEYIDLELRGRTPTLAKTICQEKNKMETLSEEMRLLYVAMTRAREKLFIVGSVKNPEEALAKWQAPVDLYHLKKAGSLLDWIMQALLKEGCPPLQPEERGQSLELPHYKVYLYTAEESVAKYITDETIGDFTSEATPLEESLYKAVNQRLSYHYPHEEAEALPGKMTVTEIKQMMNEANFSRIPDVPKRIERPAFMLDNAAQITAAQRGTALHFMMQSLSLEGVRAVAEDPQALRTFLDQEKTRLVESALIQKELAQTINIVYIEKFFKSKIGERLLASPRVRREVPFNYQYNPKNLSEKWKNIEAPLMVQGMIDCCFLEDDAWVLLDYKTDRYANEVEKKRLVENYGVQINFYAEALAALTKKVVKEKVLCLVVMEEMLLV